MSFASSSALRAFEGGLASDTFVFPVSASLPAEDVGLDGGSPDPGALCPGGRYFRL